MATRIKFARKLVNGVMDDPKATPEAKVEAMKQFNETIRQFNRTKELQQSAGLDRLEKVVAEIADLR